MGTFYDFAFVVIVLNFASFHVKDKHEQYLDKPVAKKIIPTRFHYRGNNKMNLVNNSHGTHWSTYQCHTPVGKYG